MKRSSPLDCQSIGQSLKRVKISTSPGELRLDRDIESLILGGRWASTAQAPGAVPIEGGWPRHGGTASPRGGRIHGELFRHDARLARDPVDPLRLRLTYFPPPPPTADRHSGTGRPSSPLPPERWTFLIRMPRMYPHVPPVVARVTRDFSQNNENASHLGNRNVSCDYNYYSASTTIVASSALRAQVEPPVPQQIFVRPLPPTPHSGFRDGGDDRGPELSDIDRVTAVFDSWSPVSSLQDLIDFLVGIPSRRREWWSVESNRKRPQQQHRVLGYHVSGASPMEQPTIAPVTSSAHARQYQHYQAFHQPKQQQILPSDTNCNMEDDGDIKIVESMMEDARHGFTGERHANPFTENRFDVGYPKPCQQWGIP